MILSCQSISKSFGTDEILKDVSFHIEANEKAAIVGINGAGKSTLLKIIMQKETPDTGEVILAKDATIGYLAQYQDVSGHRTIYEEVLDAKKNIIEMEERLRGMEAQMNALTGQELEALLDGYHRLSHEFELLGGYTYRSEVTGILKGLGFSESEFDRQMSELSGGQKTRVSLGKLLVTKPYGGVEQDDFLNGAIEIETLLSPMELLTFLQQLEQEAHRERKVHWGPRTLDLDILFYEDVISNDPKLLIPHRDMQNRRFVLEPLSELCPCYVNQLLQKTVYEMLMELPD